MDKNIIQKYLTERFISEATNGNTPGISVTNSVNKKSGAINKSGVKAIEKDVNQYDKDLKKNKSEVKDNKFNYNSTEEMEYHNDMEIMNGQEMVEYDREPNKVFKDKAKEAIEGSSRMANKGGKGMGNAEESWNASSDSFGKDFVKRVKATTKKREEASDSVMSFGDDVETVPKGSVQKGKHSAIQENDESTSKKIEAGYGTEDEYEFNQKEKYSNPDIKENNDKSKIKESMKRLKFNKVFNGVGNALKMIPETYKVDNKVFEMTDGIENYKIRWEGTLNEGKAIVLLASDKKMVSEDIQHMKHLMGYKPQETLGSSKKVSRLTEHAIFNDILGKSKRLVEGEDIDDQTAPEGEWDDINVPQASDAKKDIEGSTSDDKGTQAPAPKTGEWDEINMPQASDAKKHVEGSVATEAKTNAPAPKEGHWDEINVPQASDAKKDITMKENEEKEEIPVNNEDPKSQPGYVHEDDEEEEEEVIDENVKLMVSESTGKLYIVGATDKPYAVPVKDNAKALKNPKKYISEVFKK